MSHSRLLAATFLVATLVSFQVAAEEKQSVQENQIKLTVIKYDDHIKVECSPASTDTASRKDWKAICNEKASPQIQQLVAAGTINSLSGPVFDLTPENDTDDKLLSRHISLSK